MIHILAIITAITDEDERSLVEDLYIKHGKLSIKLKIKKYFAFFKKCGIKIIYIIRILKNMIYRF